jgi:hypothetical protein
MIMTWLAVLAAFIKAQWLPIMCAIATLVIWEAGRRKLRKSEAQLKAQSEDAFTILARRDATLIAAAVARLDGKDPNKAAYIELLGYRLEFLVRKFKKSHDLSRKLGISALISSSISSFITGSGFFAGLTVGLSFTVTSCGVVALAIVQFLNSEADAVNNLLLAERIRLEIQQFIGASSEYAGLPLDKAYDLFAATVDGLMAHHITIQEAESKARVAAKNATDAPSEKQ